MVHFDATLGRYPYTGFKTAGEQPIARDAVRAAGIEVVVAGRRYGKGSSREHSVVAEAAAGVRLVIAESFERIYRQNADNVGLLTSTDFGLVERIRRGEPIALDELLAGRDALTAAIVRAGGLIAYGKARLRGAAHAARSRRTVRRRHARCSRRSSIATRIATADTPARLAPGQGGFVRADLRFIHEYYTGMCAHLLQQAFGDTLALHEPASIVAFEDHLSYVHRSPVHVAQGLVGNVRRAVACAPRLRRAVRAHAPRLPAAAARCRRCGQHRLAGHLARDGRRALRVAGAADRRHRFAHPAFRRARLRGVRRRHHRHRQCLRHRRGAHHDARVAARRRGGPAARRRDGQGRGAAPAGAARRARRRRCRQGVRVRRPGGARRCRSTSARR